MSKTRPLRIVVIISGNGSNLQAIIEASQQGKLTAEIVGVISNRPTAYGLQRAAANGISHQIVDHTQYASRADFEAALTQQIDAYTPDLILLAGFMRILRPQTVEPYRGRMLNIHPSLLPDFPGLNTHQRVLDAGVTEHGASIHYVTPTLDGGPVVLQARVPVCPGDTAEQLASRVLNAEHRLYPQVIQWIATGRLQMNAQQQPVLDGHIMTQPIQQS